MIKKSHNRNIIDALAYIPLGTRWYDITTTLISQANWKESYVMSTFFFTSSSERPSRVMKWLGRLTPMTALYFWDIYLVYATLVPSISRVNAILPLPSESESLVICALILSSMVYRLNEMNGFIPVLSLILWILRMTGPNKFLY